MEQSDGVLSFQWPKCSSEAPDPLANLFGYDVMLALNLFATFRNCGKNQGMIYNLRLLSKLKPGKTRVVEIAEFSG